MGDMNDMNEIQTSNKTCWLTLTRLATQEILMRWKETQQCRCNW